MNLLSEVRTVDKDKAVQQLIFDSSPRQSFFLMVILSVAMATFGMLLDSVAVVIGSMLIAPVLFPLLSLSLGMVVADYKMVAIAFGTMVKASLLGVAAAAILAAIFSFQQPEITNEIIKRTSPNILNVAVAIVAGVAVSYAITKPSINESFAGVAISVSLVPPLAVIGVGLSRLDMNIAGPAVVLFLFNVIGIMFSSMIVFSLLGFAKRKKVIHEVVVKDERALRKEADKE